MQADDARFIVALHGAPHARGYLVAPTVEHVVATIGDGTERRIILDSNGTPVGMWAMGIAAGWLADLQRIATIEPRRGIGRWALERMLSIAFEENRAHRAYLEVTEDNLPARRLYEKAGFVLEGTFRDGFRTPEGAFKNLCAYGLVAEELRVGEAEGAADVDHR